MTTRGMAPPSAATLPWSQRARLRRWVVLTLAGRVKLLIVVAWGRARRPGRDGSAELVVTMINPPVLRHDAVGLARTPARGPRGESRPGWLLQDGSTP